MADEDHPAPSPEGESDQQPEEMLLAEDAAVEASDELEDVVVEASAEQAEEVVAEQVLEANAEQAEEIVAEQVEAAVVAEAAVELVEEAVAEAGVEQAETAAAPEPVAAEEAEIEEEEEDEPAPREKPAVPGAHLEVDIVPEGVDPLSRGESYEDSYAVDPYAIEDEAEEAEEDEDARDDVLAEPISTAAIDLASGARYRATGKRKSAIARVTLRPGTGSYVVNGRTLETHFPRLTLQRNIRQPLETVGYQDRMDVVARLHGGGISAQAGALRHGVSRALLEADPNLRGELKRRGFLTRDSRAKERKKAGLKKARKRPQFSKR
jgi:small subunit ribosomal protein S9